jgi:hypothetical protein
LQLQLAIAGADIAPIACAAADLERLLFHFLSQQAGSSSSSTLPSGQSALKLPLFSGLLAAAAAAAPPSPDVRQGRDAGLEVAQEHVQLLVTVEDMGTWTVGNVLWGVTADTCRVVAAIMCTHGLDRTLQDAS